MRGDGGKATRRLAVSAVISALGVVLLFLGSLIQVLDLSMAAIVSVLVVFAVIEIRGPYPFLIYTVTSVLALLLLPVKTPALIYALFAGYYPILKGVLEGHLSKPLAWALKVLVFCVGAAAAVLVAAKVLLVDLTWAFANWWIFLLLIPVFVIYDIALTRLISGYLNRWRTRFKFLNLH